MRKALETRIAAAVLAKLQAESFSVPAAQFSRSSLPVLEKEKLVIPKVVIVPTSKVMSDDNREVSKNEVSIGICVAASVGLAAEAREAQVETLSGFVEEIQEFLALRSNHYLVLPEITSGSDVIQEEADARLVLPIVNSPIFDPQRLRESGIFFSVSTFNYQSFFAME